MILGGPRAHAARLWLDDRLAALERERSPFHDPDEPLSAEHDLLLRVSAFPFLEYPDYAVPWHLLQWPRMRWDHVHATVQVVESLKHAKGAAMGRPIVLEPMQVLFFLCVLGPYDPETGRRLVREALLTMSRKGGKSALVGGLVLAMLGLDREMGGLFGQEAYVGASDREQAGIMFDIVSKYILQDRRLGISDRFHIIPSKKAMTHLNTLSTFKVLSSDAYRAHGYNPALVILDEIGNVPPQVAEDFYAVLTSGFGGQEEPLTALLSTQAPTDTHLFSQQVDRCKRINEGKEEAMDVAGFVFETPEQLNGKKMDPWDEEVWYLSNPLLGVAPSIEDMRAEAQKARAIPSLEAKFRNLRLNQRANPYNPLITKSLWDACAGTVDVEDLLGRPCYAGLDLSTITDLSSLVLVFDEDPDGRRPVLPYFWIPGDGLKERQNRDKVPYDVWIREGYLNADSHKTIDYDLIAARIEWSLENFEVLGFGFDRWRIKDLQAAMRRIGLDNFIDDKDRFFPIGQGYRDGNSCVEALEQAALNAKINHGNNPILTWNVANTVVVTDPSNNRKFNKAKSYGRIDGTVALAMALRAREMQGHEEEGPSAFETEDCLM